MAPACHAYAAKAVSSPLTVTYDVLSLAIRPERQAARCNPALEGGVEEGSFPIVAFECRRGGFSGVCVPPQVQPCPACAVAPRLSQDMPPWGTEAKACWMAQVWRWAAALLCCYVALGMP